MKTLLSAVLAFSCTAVNAEVYTCPQVYPGKNVATMPLTGASMMSGELHGNGFLHGDEEKVAGGYDARYGFADDEQAWLICLYGGRKRTKVDMGWPGTQWWMKLAPQVGRCTVQVREGKNEAPAKSTWTATATCVHQ